LLLTINEYFLDKVERPHHHRKTGLIDSILVAAVDIENEGYKTKSSIRI
jgi:hypothetical protein